MRLRWLLEQLWYEYFENFEGCSWWIVVVVVVAVAVAVAVAVVVVVV